MGAERQFTAGYAIPPGWPMPDNRQFTTTEIMNTSQGPVNAHRSLATNNSIFTQNKRSENPKNDSAMPQTMNMMNVMNTHSSQMNIKSAKGNMNMKPVQPAQPAANPPKTMHKRENVVMFETRKPKPLKQPPPNAPSLPYVCAICDQGTCYFNIHAVPVVI